MKITGLPTYHSPSEESNNSLASSINARINESENPLTQKQKRQLLYDTAQGIAREKLANANAGKFEQTEAIDEAVKNLQEDGFLDGEDHVLSGQEIRDDLNNKYNYEGLNAGESIGKFFGNLATDLGNGLNWVNNKAGQGLDFGVDRVGELVGSVQNTFAGKGWNNDEGTEGAETANKIKNATSASDLAAIPSAIEDFGIMAGGAALAPFTAGASAAAIPGVLAGKAALENAEDIGDAFSGRDTVTGELKNDTERGVSGVGSGAVIALSALPGTGKIASALGKQAGKEMAEEAIKKEVPELANKLAGEKSAQEIESTLAKSLTENPASKVELDKNLDKKFLKEEQKLAEDNNIKEHITKAFSGDNAILSASPEGQASILRGMNAVRNSLKKDAQKEFNQAVANNDTKKIASMVDEAFNREGSIKKGIKDIFWKTPSKTQDIVNAYKGFKSYNPSNSITKGIGNIAWKPLTTAAPFVGSTAILGMLENGGENPNADFNANLIRAALLGSLGAKAGTKATQKFAQSSLGKFWQPTLFNNSATSGNLAMKMLNKNYMNSMLNKRYNPDLGTNEQGEDQNTNEDWIKRNISNAFKPKGN